MKEINRIVIKGSSGYTSMEYAYNDKFIITPNSISYECNPIVEISELSKISKQKWSYKTTSKKFKDVFENISTEIIKDLDKEQTELWCDIGAIEIVVEFADKTKRRALYYVGCEYFHDTFKLIKKLVPRTEQLPEVLQNN